MDIVLRYLERLADDNNLITIVISTQNLVAVQKILLLIGAHRRSTIYMFIVDNMTLNDMLPNVLAMIYCNLFCASFFLSQHLQIGSY